MPVSYRVSASRTIAAPAARIYQVLADYRVGHPRILASAFTNLVVEQGGFGEGTVITFDMRVLGRTSRVRGVVSEPEPGRVLVERYPDTGIVTTFAVEPAGAAQSVVTISSDVPARSRFTAPLERWLTTRALRPVFDEELGRIDSYVTAGSPAA